MKNKNILKQPPLAADLTFWCLLLLLLRRRILLLLLILLLLRLRSQQLVERPM